MSSPSSRESATRNAWAALPDGARRALVHGLSASALKVLFAEVFSLRAQGVTAAELRRRWESDRFVRPAGCDPRALSALEARLWQLIPEVFAAVELSPLTPFGTCAALAGIGQDRIVSTAGGTEVVSDSTTTLALETARRRRAQAPGEQIHLAASHRQLRAQPMGNASAHFKLLTLVSSARDQGSGRTEADLITLHLRTWRRVLSDMLPDHQSILEISAWSPVLAERVNDVVRPDLGHHDRVVLVEAPERSRARGYYTDLALRLVVSTADGQVEVGDGGLTGWTAALNENHKERCLISCISIERLLALAEC